MNRIGHWGVVLVVVLGARPAGADSWISTGGPLGGLGYDVRIHPRTKQTMFVTDNYAGVIKSVDGGKTWRPSNTGITVRGGPSGDAYTIFSLTIDPNNPDVVWAGTNGDQGAFGIFKSTDGGATWSLRNGGITDAGFGIVFRGFTVQQGNSSVVYAQAELPTSVHGREFNRTDGRVYKTSNGGDTWSLLWSGASLARYLIIDPGKPTTLYLSTGIFDREASNSSCEMGLAGAGGVGVVKSIDGGMTWAPVNTGLGDLYVGALRMHPLDSQTLFAATGNNACSGPLDGNIVSGLYRTTNGGTSWQKLLGGDIFTTVAFSPSSPQVVYAGSARAFRRSNDGGTTWQTFAKPSAAEWGPAGVRAGVPIDITIDPDDPNVVYANNYGGGVFASTDGAQSWQIWSRGYSGAEIHALAVADTRPGTVYAIGRSGPFASANFGLDWAGIGNGAAIFPEWNAVALQPGSPDVVVISDEHQGVLLRSTNGGASFTQVLRHPDANAAMPARRQGFKALAFAPSSPAIAYAGLAKDRGTIDASSPMGTVLYRSDNGGLTFTAASANLDGRNVHRLLVDRSNAAVVWAATSGGLWKSGDSGVTWSVVGFAGQNVVAVAIHPSNSQAVVASIKNVGIFVSADGGTTWPGGPFNTGFTNPNPAVVALRFDAGGALYAGDFYSGVYRSMDGGKSWAGFPDGAMTGLRMRAVKDLLFAGTVLYAATQGGGVFRYGGPGLVPTPVAADFGAIAIGAASAARTLTVYNTGTAARVLTGRSLAGANAGEFRIQNDTCTAALATAAACTFEVVFAPTVAGARAAVANVGSDDPFAAIFSIPLTGSGTAPPPDAAAVPDGGTVDAAVDERAPSDGAPRDASSVDGAAGAGGGGGTGGSGGSPTVDAASGPDARPPSGGKSGCGCSLGGATGRSQAWGVLLALLVGAWRRRPRPKSEPSKPTKRDRG